MQSWIYLFLLYFLSLSFVPFAQAKYIVLEDLPQKNKASFSITKVAQKENEKDSPKFKIQIHNKTTIVDILEAGYEDLPLLKLKDTKMENTEVYAVKATTGTSGVFYHYFLVDQKNNGAKIDYLGFYPELEPQGGDEFIAFEKDGPRTIETHWKLSKEKLIQISQKVY
jgi:hypothetical protein